MNSAASACVVTALLCLCGSVAGSQDTATTKLAPVIVEVSRGTNRSPLDLPFALTIQLPDSSRPGQRHLALDEALALIPGFAVANRNNPAQDPRISIRGFGARSAFGVRGIRVLRDGIPLTLPDGQTPVDYLDLESVGRVEVLRGSASSLYGNAGGGVVNIRSATPDPVPLSGLVRAWNGAFQSRRVVGKLGGTSRGFTYQGDAAHTESEGYRDHSRQRMNNAFARVALDAGSGSYSLQWMGMKTPLAENPGALTRAQFELNPRSADVPSVQKSARKVVSQSQFGLTARREASRGDAEMNAYAGTRALYNPLTFAIVDVGRTTSGGNLRGSAEFGPPGFTQRLTAGAEVQRQNDLRRNYANCNGLVTSTAACPNLAVERGSVTLDQWEIVSSLGVYLRDELSLGERFTATASARADAVRFEVRDRLVSATNPDDSGRRSLQSVSPMFGLVARLSPTHSAYANVSTAFETPTATELGNSPSGSGGVNRELQPQRSTTYEVGVKGVESSGLQYSAAAFFTGVRDELIPFDIPASGGRRYFRNAGRTTRRGIELGGSAIAGPVDFSTAYTYANYRFLDFTVDTAHYAGRRIPGIPRQSLQTSATMRSPLATLVGEATMISDLFVNDANSERAPGYAVFNLRAVRDIPLARSSAELVVGAQNIFDTPYVASVSVNATAGKFYEPGPQRSFFVGISLSAGARPAR